MSDLLIQALYSPTCAREIWLDYTRNGNLNGLTLSEIDQIEQHYHSSIKNWERSASIDNNEYEITDDEFDDRINTEIDNIEDETGVDEGGDKFWRWASSGGSAVAGGAGVVLSTMATGDGLGGIGKKVLGFGNKVGVNTTPTHTSQLRGLKDGVKTAEANFSKASASYSEKCEKLMNLEQHNMNSKIPVDTSQAEADVADALKAKNAANNEVTAANDKLAQEKEASTKENTMAYIEIGIATATAVKYWALKPNEKEKDAVLAMQEQMVTGQQETAAAAQEMLNMEANAIAISDQAYSVNEAANNAMLVEKAEFDFEANVLVNLQKKADTRGGLTQEEQDLYVSLATEAQATSGIISAIQTNTTSEVSSLNTELEGMQSGFDDAATTAINLQAMTEYTASFDNSTKNTCYVEGVAQGLNVYSATTASVKLLGNSGPCWWNYAIAAVGFAAAASSGVAIGQQMNYASQIKGEIDVRTQAETINANTFTTYDSTIQGYGSALDMTYGLEMLVPEDTEAPVDTKAPELLKEDEEDEK